jgi:protein-disulfide isomerase
MSATKFFPAVALAILLSVAPTTSMAQAPTSAAGNTPSASSNQDQILKNTEKFVRQFFGWGADFKLKLGPLRDSPSPEFYVVPLEVTLNDQMTKGEVYVSKDGKTLLRGEMFDMSTDPYADNRSKLHLEGNPSRGSADAPVTVVEFADFECPTCRATEPAVKFVLENYKVHFVYKDFPLTAIHPWAETAAIGARCIFEQSPDAFWKAHDTIFQSQDQISTENVWDKLAQLGTDQGLDAAALKVCMSSEAAKKIVEASRDEGVALGVTGTPTFFVNGRPVAGGDVNSLRRFIDFEMAEHK